MPKTGNEFGRTIRALRERQGISLRKCAAQISVSPTYLSKVERGDLPPFSEQALRSVAGVIEADVDELLGLAGRVPKDVLDLIRRDPSLVQTVRTLGRMSPEGRSEINEQCQRLLARYRSKAES